MPPRTSAIGVRRQTFPLLQKRRFFAMSLMYAATSLDFDSHPMDGFGHEEMKKSFKIPDNFSISFLLAVGYRRPDLKLQPANCRKSVKKIIVSTRKLVCICFQPPLLIVSPN
jgi:nitroreductase